MKRKGIIIDLDGTLCNVDHRRHHVHGENKDWKSFFAGIDKDPVNEWCRQLVLSMHKKYRIIFVTGRAEEYRTVSVQWLVKNIGFHAVGLSPLFMRKNGDFREDFIIKREIYERKIKPDYDILFCVDDRDSVVKMWREQGLDVLHCSGEGGF
jgi:hydroxymethylpyrimidine pyrophosphatase-like HAD family hydrolase